MKGKKIIKKIWSLGNLKLHTKYKETLRESHKLFYLFWECTLNCNFNCKHCGSNAGSEKVQGELSTDEIKKAFGEIAEDFDPKEIMIAITGGEPLVRRDLFDVGQYIHGLGFSWGIATNGYLIDEDTADKMQSTGMRTIAVSVDGIGQTHDDFRGAQGAYQRTIDAVKLLADRNFLKDLQITTTVHRDNFHQLASMYEFFLPLGISSWKLVNVDPIGRAEHNQDIFLTNRQLRELFDFIKTKRKESKNVDITYPCPGFLGLDYEKQVRQSYFRCDAGINVGSILHNGDIFICPDVPRYPHLIQGNVKKDRFGEIWNNKFSFFRDKNRMECEECRACDWWNECRGGAVHLWDFENNQPKICHLDIIKNGQ